MDRRRMRDRVFTDPAARTRLEGILHPAIRAEMERQSRAAVQGPYQILAIPLLTEGGRRYDLDRVLVVDAPEVSCRSRASMQRDHVQRDRALAALAGGGKGETHVSNLRTT